MQQDDIGDDSVDAKVMTNPRPYFTTGCLNDTLKLDERAVSDDEIADELTSAIANTETPGNVAAQGLPELGSLPVNILDSPPCGGSA